jgi:hypothetical protein
LEAKAMTFRIQFFSRPSDDGALPEQAEFGYDGSMTVENIAMHDLAECVAELDQLAERMDCIYGEVMCIVTWASVRTGRDMHTAFRFNHSCKA